MAKYGKIEQRNKFKYSQRIRSHLNITTQTTGNVCICYCLTVFPQIFGILSPSPQIFGICSSYFPKYLIFAHRVSPNIKDWFGCSNHPTHKSTNSYPDPGGGREKVVNVDDNGDHEKGVNSGDNGVHEEGFNTLIMT